jgi:hypothetical protein
MFSLPNPSMIEIWRFRKYRSSNWTQNQTLYIQWTLRAWRNETFDSRQSCSYTFES